MQIKFEDGSIFETTNPHTVQAVRQVLLQTPPSYKKEGTKLAEAKPTKRTKRFLLGARDWRLEDTLKVYERSDEMRKTGATESEICQKIAQEFGRTPSAIYNRLHNAKIREMVSAARHQVNV